MVREIKAPGQLTKNAKPSDLKIFLAGTIDNGESEDWQSVVKGYLLRSQSSMSMDVVLYNPRRDEWDVRLEQSFEEPRFYQQVSWEINALKKADYIIMNILPDSKSPITLLELGLHADSGKLIVCCPSGFYRSGNVQVVCDKYDIPLYDSIDVLVADLVNNYLKD